MRQRDVLQDQQVRAQDDLLAGQPDPRLLGGRDPGTGRQDGTVRLHGPGVGYDEPRDDLHERGLAGAIVADDAECLAVRQPHRDVNDGLCVAVGLRHRVHDEHVTLLTIIGGRCVPIPAAGRRLTAVSSLELAVAEPACSPGCRRSPPSPRAASICSNRCRSPGLPATTAGARHYLSSGSGTSGCAGCSDRSPSSSAARRWIPRRRRCPDPGRSGPPNPRSWAES